MCCQGTMHIRGFEGRKVASLTREEMKQVQIMVGMKGSTVDGRDGPLTRQRIEAFERRHKLGHYDKNHSHAAALR